MQNRISDQLLTKRLSFLFFKILHMFTYLVQGMNLIRIEVMECSPHGGQDRSTHLFQTDDIDIGPQDHHAQRPHVCFLHYFMRQLSFLALKAGHGRNLWRILLGDQLALVASAPHSSQIKKIPDSKNLSQLQLWMLPARGLVHNDCRA